MRILLCLLSLLLALPAAAQPPGSYPPPDGPWQSKLDLDRPLVGRIWLPADHRFTTPEELAVHLGTADFVLLGEHHDNPDHHRLQAWALAQVIAAGRRPVVAFEMINPEQDAALQRQLSEHPDDVDGLATALDWSHNQWPEWAFYRPIFAEAVAARLPIRPANLPTNLLRALARGVAVPEVTRRQYRLDAPVDPATGAALAQEIRDSHCGQMPERAIPGMVEVQRARDAAMALAMTTDAPNGAVLIAGAGHTRNDRGVPAQLAAMAPGRRIFSLGFQQVDSDEDNPDAYGTPMGASRPPFDAVWFTPRISDEDPCAGLAEFLKKKQEREAAKPPAQ